jgi:serine/threonine protein kinase
MSSRLTSHALESGRLTLTRGTRLGPYEILSGIGAGGMGEVYRATDTNLKRQVAIKVLPVSVAADADRLARFQREAEVLAALNHPNIAHIFGLEKSDGTIALAMELVDGPTHGIFSRDRWSVSPWRWSVLRDMVRTRQWVGALSRICSAAES